MMTNTFLEYCGLTSNRQSLLMALPFAIGLLMYMVMVLRSNQKYKKWPNYRTFLLLLGSVSAVIAVASPMAQLAHVDFRAHMVVHLLLGMLAPLFFVLAKPMHLLLRSLHVTWARRLSRLLKSKVARFYMDPVVASLLNIGGLWVLYTTDLYQMMHYSPVWHIISHIHVFAAGYLFTAAMIDTFARVHRVSYLYRAIVLVPTLTGHGILSKYVYAHPPRAVLPYQAESCAKNHVL